MTNSMVALLPTLIAERVIEQIAQTNGANLIRKSIQQEVAGKLACVLTESKSVKVLAVDVETPLNNGQQFFESTMEKVIDVRVRELVEAFENSIIRANGLGEIKGVSFIEFTQASTYSANSPVDESIITGIDNDISVRVQKYYDASLWKWYYSLDAKWIIF